MELLSFTIKAIPQWAIVTVLFAITLIIAGATIAVVWIIWRKRFTLTNITLPFGVSVNFNNQKEIKG